jgi:hypothetical protein
MTTCASNWDWALILTADNITAGAAYLRQMYRRYGYPGMFAAYNAGSGHFDDFLLWQRPLPSETLAYVAKISPGAETAFSSIGLSTASLSSRGFATLAGTFRGAFRVPGHAQRALCAAVPAQSLKDLCREIAPDSCRQTEIRGRAR